jgi:hypothetical protein
MLCYGQAQLCLEGNTLEVLLQMCWCHPEVQHQCDRTNGGVASSQLLENSSFCASPSPVYKLNPNMPW